MARKLEEAFESRFAKMPACVDPKQAAAASSSLSTPLNQHSKPSMTSTNGSMARVGTRRRDSSHSTTTVKSSTASTTHSPVMLTPNSTTGINSAQRMSTTPVSAGDAKSKPKAGGMIPNKQTSSGGSSKRKMPPQSTSSANTSAIVSSSSVKKKKSSKKSKTKQDESSENIYDFDDRFDEDAYAQNLSKKIKPPKQPQSSSDSSSDSSSSSDNSSSEDDDNDSDSDKEMRSLQEQLRHINEQLIMLAKRKKSKKKKSKKSKKTTGAVNVSMPTSSGGGGSKKSKVNANANDSIDSISPYMHHHQPPAPGLMLNKPDQFITAQSKPKSNKSKQAQQQSNQFMMGSGAGDPNSLATSAFFGNGNIPGMQLAQQQIRKPSSKSKQVIWSLLRLFFQIF